jgi:hypothetical protein
MPPSNKVQEVIAKYQLNPRIQVRRSFCRLSWQVLNTALQSTSLRASPNLYHQE